MLGCSSLVGSCHNTGPFLKLMTMIARIKMMSVPYLDKSMLLSRFIGAIHISVSLEQFKSLVLEF